MAAKPLLPIVSVMASYEAEQERLRQMMEDVMDENNEILDDAYDDESEEAESDHEEEQLENSDSEQDISDVEETDEILSNSLSFIGKDGTRWRKHSSTPRTVRTRKENIITRLPGPSAATRTLKNSLEIWEYFINDEMINMIVICTNAYIESITDKFARSRDVLPTNVVEIRALLGLLYMAGTYHANRLNAEDLWKTDGSGVEIFRLTMSLQRFRFLLRCLRFDKKATRPERRSSDKLAAIRDFFDLFNTNCQRGYHHSAYVTIDEMLVGFRGRCSFRQYIPSKPNKYGLKILAICDALMFFTSKLEVYVGLQPEGPYKLSNTPYDVVLRLCQHISGSGRNVTMDNWFTLPLIKKLLSDHKLTSIGTIRKNKRKVPLEFSKPVSRPPCTSMFGFTQESTLLSYIPKKNKNVLLISTLHHHDEIDEDTGDLHKPTMITEYNRTKGGVDVVDKLTASYNVARNTRRWPMVIFYSILNIAGINSQVIYAANNPSITILRRNFLKQLANELILPQLRVRAVMTTLPKALKARLEEFCEPNTIEVAETTVPNAEKGRCAYCDRKKNRKTRFACFHCNKYMCLEHLGAICRCCQKNALF